MCTKLSCMAIEQNQVSIEMWCLPLSSDSCQFLNYMYHRITVNGKKLFAFTRHHFAQQSLSKQKNLFQQIKITGLKQNPHWKDSLVVLNERDIQSSPWNFQHSLHKNDEISMMKIYPNGAISLSIPERPTKPRLSICDQSTTSAPDWYLRWQGLNHQGFLGTVYLSRLAKMLWHTCGPVLTYTRLLSS